MSPLIQPLMRLVCGGAVLLILLGTALIPFDDLADPLRPWGRRIRQTSSACIFSCSFITAAPAILRLTDRDVPALLVGGVERTATGS